MIVDSIYFKGHTCFKNDWSGFDTIRPINVIIGRYNSGKSHLLELVQALCSGQLDGRGWQYRGRGKLDEDSLRQRFREGTFGGDLSGADHWHHHGRHFVGVDVTWETDKSGNIADVTFPGYLRRVSAAELVEVGRVVRNPASELLEKRFRQLLADRDIHTESSTTKLSLRPDGRGAWNIVRRYITTSNREISRDVVQRALLSDLNTIFGSDGKFTEIQIKEHDDAGTGSTTKNHWEIYLGEARKGLVPLSKSGSGLKTVLLVLLNLLVIPDVESKDKAEFVFAFEELENNLHPALLRRLFQYIERYAVKEQATVFLTTHSSTALDFFGTSEHAQIIRVSHDGESAHATRISAHFDRLGMIAELGARPSDLLQANGIVWVEGPSDRIYLNRWIELCSDGELREGRNYQCAFYGGALLARTQFKAPDEAQTELANLLQVNANIVVVCDSDRSSKRARLQDRVRRIRKEVGKTPAGHIWITRAREIENYLPAGVLEQASGASSLPDPGQFESFFPRKRSRHRSYVEENLNRRHFDKMDLATLCAPHMTREMMESRFDWNEQMAKLVERIESWNR